MSQKMLFIIVGGALIGGIAAGVYFLFRAQENTASVELAPLAQISPTPTPVENIKYQNEAGFSFEHPSDVTVKENELDATTYADLVLSSETDGSIDITIVDTKLKDLAAWKKQNKVPESMKAEDVQLGDLTASQETLNTGKTTLTAIGQGVLYTITVNPDDNFEYWQRVYEVVVSSWKFELPEEEPVVPVQGSGAMPAASGDTIYEEETIE